MGDLLVIAVGTAATTFVDTFIDLPVDPIGEIVNTKSGGDSQPKKLAHQPCLLYKIDNMIICQCRSYANPEDAHIWTKKVSFVVY